ncbi:Uncharacterised protein [Mycobacteroides abscessus subsp. abscessus]|nr:Uncharacterised protein [Mycobacteroides abscessus subsp. abscessus]
MGLSLSATTRLLANNSYRVSSGAIEVMFPAPSTAPTPCVWLGSRCARPAVRSASDWSTPGCSQSSALNPDSSRLSKMLSGNTETVVRPPGVTPNLASRSGLWPAWSCSRLAMRAAMAPATA